MDSHFWLAVWRMKPPSNSQEQKSMESQPVGGSGHSLTGVKNLLTTLGLQGPTEVLHAKYFPFRPQKGFSKDALMLVYCKFGLHL